MANNVKIREHETILHTTHGNFSKGEKKNVVINEGAQERPPRPRCPLNGCACSDRCALYDDGKCGIVTGGAITPGRICPYSGRGQGRRCAENCPVKTGTSCALAQGRKDGKDE